MNIKKVSIAILSDLHTDIDPASEEKAESFLIAGQVRVPVERHPIQSLAEKAPLIIGAPINEHHVHYNERLNKSQ